MLQAYPHYRAVNGRYTDSVPEHWAWAKLKHVASFDVGWTPPTGKDSNFDGTRYWANISDLTSKTIFSTAKNVSDAAALSSRMKLMPPGTLLLSFKLSVGTVAFAGAPMYTNEAIAAFPPTPGVDLGFLYYALPIWVRNNAAANIYGAKILNQELIRNAPAAVPTVTEQRSIAAFLDHETARIDRLIEKQERLIEILKEKRQAVISHAVTKGLNPDAPMKDSGVEWLGEVPGHWTVRLLSTLSTKITNGYVGPTRDVLVDEPGVRYLQSLHIKNNEIRFDKPYYVPRAWSLTKSKSILEEGDALIVQTGDIGQVATVPKEFSGANCHALIIVSPVPSLSGFFLGWLLTSTYGFHSLKAIQTGALHPHLNCDYVKTLKIPLPPLWEQEQIVKAVAGQSAKVDSAISAALWMIAILKERRSALISAAVTGKIDVRNWTPPEFKSPETATA
ncbi:MAG: restriction endonuclease subunit S [Xanthomonadales bacterium]|nr:restriction endonuclease subunit S [Xanthomonadales bacterium]